MNNNDLNPIFTIGHGRQTMESFLTLLKQHDVQFVCDVRSAARSRWPQFNGAALARLLGENGIGYEHMPECGGKIMVPPDEFAAGIARLLQLAGEMPIALMCSEGQPLTNHVTKRANCHRVGLLAPPLRIKGARIVHILPDGSTLEIDDASVPSIW